MSDLHHAATTSPTPDVPYVAGLWRSPDAFRDAARAASKAGYSNLQAYMPYPLHGIEDILGLERSLIGRPVFAICCLGFLLAFFMCWDRQVIDFPTIYSGKPYESWQLFVVVTLETGLLFGAIANLLLCFHCCRLLPNPQFTPLDARLSDDTFAIAIPITSAASAEHLKAWFEGLKADEIRVQAAPPPEPPAIAALREEVSHA
jgi:hypothetical protein